MSASGPHGGSRRLWTALLTLSIGLTFVAAGQHAHPLEATRTETSARELSAAAPTGVPACRSCILAKSPITPPDDWVGLLRIDPRFEHVDSAQLARGDLLRIGPGSSRGPPRLL